MSRYSKPLVLGETSVYARSLRSKARRDLMLVYAGMFAALGALYLLYAQFGLLELTVAFPLFVVVFFAASLLARNPKSRMARAGSGIDAENKVARILQRASIEAVVHNFMPQHARGDIDHVVLGPSLATVETKAGRGVVQELSDGGLVAGQRRIPKDPLGQARRAALDVSRATNGLPAFPIVVVTNMSNRPFRSSQGVTVCSASDLRSVLASLQPVFSSPNKARSMAKTLEGASRN